MAVNKRKVLDAARKYAQKGAKQKALKEYATLLKLDPRDAKLRLEVGDAHRRWNENEEAIGHYHKVADQYQSDGFDARAVAVYKQILNLDPKRYPAYVALSDLYQRMGLDAEAVSALQTAADGYHKEGKKRDALELLRKMAQLDPSNTTSRLKVAELLRQEGLEDDAAEEFQAVAEELSRQGEASEAEKVYERLIELCPHRTEILILMARNAIAMSKPERAETWAKRAVANGETEDSLEVMCDVYKALERTDELIDSTKALAKIYRDRGDEDMARTIMQRLPGVDVAADTSEVSEVADISDLVDHADETDEALLGEDESLADEDFLADDGTDVFELGGDAFSDAGELELGESDELELDSPAPDAAPAAAAAADVALPEGDPDQLLAEASVYLRYGKTDQAIASLRAVLADEPGHRAALEKLGEAQFEAGDSAAAIELWSNAAERAREEDDFDGFDVLCGRIAKIDEAAAAALGPARPETPAAPAPEAPADAPADAPLDEIQVDADDALFGDSEVPKVAADDDLGDEIEIDFDIDIDVDGDVVGDADGEDATPQATPAAAAPDPNSSSSTTAQQVRAELEEAEFFFEQGMFEEAEAVYERVLELAPNHPSAMLRMGEIAASRGDDPSATPDAGTTMRAGDISEEDTASSVAATPDIADDIADDIDIDVDVDIDVDIDVPGADATEQDDTPIADDPAEAVEFDLDDDEATFGVEDELAAAAAEEAPAAHAEVTQPVEDVPEVEAPVEVPAPEPPTAEIPAPLAAAADEHPDESFDLAAELSDVFGDDEDDANASSLDRSLQGTEEEAFASLFDDFKKGVSESLDDGDFETRYDLAIAYREMGLVEDAISAFQVCVACPRRGLDSLQMMAQCQLEAGRVTDAIGHLEQALSTDGLSNERRAGVYFDLGRAFTASGDYARARTTFETVSELDPSFPGVDEAVADLLERSNDPDAAAEADEDEAFESFDDLVAEATAGEAVAAVSAENEAGEGFESFADVIEEAEEVIDAAADELVVDTEMTPEPETVVDEPEAAAPVAEEEAPPEEPKPKKGRKKISFV